MRRNRFFLPGAALDPGPAPAPGVVAADASDVCVVLLVVVSGPLSESVVVGVDGMVAERRGNTPGICILGNRRPCVVVEMESDGRAGAVP